MLQIGSIVDGKYKVLSKIGQGGMSVVYLALNERANKTWAIKEVRKDGVQDFATVKQGLITETNILKSLNHKYLPSIVDVIDDEDTFLIVMDYIQGKSLNVILRESMEQEGYPISVEDTISWGKQLCEVLYYLHTRKRPIIYRDLKPANVMLKPDGEISLIDFGTAKIFKTGKSEDTTCLGTPGYAAPEQYGGNGQSRPQSDIYCLGATLHHLITGRNPAATPFNFPRITQCRPTLLEETPRELRNTLLGLEMIIDKCTQYEVEDRYQSCAELKYDLEHPDELGIPYRKKLRNKMIAFAGSAAMAIILGSVSLFGLVMENKTEKSGYDYYIRNAQRSAASEAVEQYRKAVALNPTSEDAYLGMLNAMLQGDDKLTDEEDIIIRQMLDSKDNGRNKDNDTYFRANKSGYAKFSYQLGLVYYFSESSTGNKDSAKGWFANILNADMDDLDFGEDDSKKYAWLARAKTLSKICEYSGKIGEINILGDQEVSYADYWYDMCALMEAEVTDLDYARIELGLYTDIVTQIFNNASKFREAGISQEQMEQMLDDILNRMSTMDIDDAGYLEMEENVKRTQRNIISAFASNAQVTESAGNGGKS